ncbi:MAG: hypothetical protein JXR70_15720 [Spirochaetales bacterium]|nr:hypothetical protein [Spirochaetales bacterium]
MSKGPCVNSFGHFVGFSVGVDFDVLQFFAKHGFKIIAEGLAQSLDDGGIAGISVFGIVENIVAALDTDSGVEWGHSVIHSIGVGFVLDHFFSKSVGLLFKSITGGADVEFGLDGAFLEELFDSFVSQGREDVGGEQEIVMWVGIFVVKLAAVHGCIHQKV